MPSTAYDESLFFKKLKTPPRNLPLYMGQLFFKNISFSQKLQPGFDHQSKCTARGLQILLDVCQAYAESHGIIFNCSKTVCMMFKTNNSKSMVIPLLTLGGQSVKYVNHYKYLGIMLDTKLSNDKDIQRQP